MKVKTKLFLMVGIPVLALVILLIYGSNSFYAIKNYMRENNSLQKDKSTILESYYNMSQAHLASVNALSSNSTEQIQELVNDSEKNIAATFKKLNAISGRFTPEMKKIFQEFTEQYNQWKQSNSAFFSLISETITANEGSKKGALKAVEAFANMRKVTEKLNKLISQKLQDSTIDWERRRKLNEALLKVLKGDRSAYQAYVTGLDVLETSDVAAAKKYSKVFNKKFNEAKDFLIQGVHPLGRDGDKLKVNFAIYFQLWSSSSKKSIALHTDNIEKNVLRKKEFENAYSHFLALQNILRKLEKTEAAQVDNELLKMDGTIDDFVSVYNSVAITCIVISILITLFVATHITRPLKKTVAFATAIADGDFLSEFDVKQKDEVGQVARAVQRIPKTLTLFQNELKSMSETIDSGFLRNRGDESKFNGAYKQLMIDVNTVADVYTGFLDTVPMPLLAIDLDYNIQFMNTHGANLERLEPEKLIGMKCHDIFKTSDCNTENCACKQAMQFKEIRFSETDAHPKAGDLEIKYIGAPNYTRDGSVVGAFEMIVDQTENVRSHQKMQNIAGKAAEIAERLSSASDEISVQVEQSSKGAQTQRDRSTETASAMEEMNATVLEVAQSAASAAGSADSAKLKAMEGAGIVENVVTAIAKVQEQAVTLQENMSALGDQALDIGRIMNVISDIADQTNLLALNAAIEAARAGEAGRGFAVVADEVRKLAEKTMQATVEVDQSITGIQNGAKQNVEGTEKAVAAITESTDLAKEAGGSLGEIVAMSETTADQVRNIATAAEQQSSTADEIARSTEQIHRISTETADAMAQSAQAVAELAQLAGDLRSMIDELRETQA